MSSIDDVIKEEIANNKEESIPLDKQEHDDGGLHLLA